MNQTSNIPVIRLGVLEPAVGMIIEMIRHYTVNQASNIPGGPDCLVSGGKSASSQIVAHQK